MKNKIRQILSLSLCWGILFCSIPASYATFNSYSDNNLPVSTILTDGETASSLVPSSVSYEYTITDNSSSPDVICIDMDIMLNYPSHTTVCSVYGQLPVYTLSSGESYMYGALEGTAIIDAKKYNITVGFQKFNTASDISATLTIANSTDETIVKFGNLHVQYNVVKDLFETSSIPSPVSTSPLNVSSSGESPFTYQKNFTSKLNNKLAIKQSIYADLSKSRILVMVTPYISNLESIHTISGDVTANVSVDRITMQINEISTTEATFEVLLYGGTSKIDGEGGLATGSDAINFLAEITSLIFDKFEIDSNLPNHLSILSALLNMLPNPSAEVHLYGDVVTANYSNLQMSDEDWDDYGLSVAFQVDPISGSDTSVVTQYNYCASIRYSVTVTDSMGEVSHIYRTAETDNDYSITFPQT